MRVLKQLRARRLAFGGEEHSGWLPEEAAVPRPTEIEEVFLDFRIVEASQGGYFLQWEGPEPRYTGDTWHRSLEDALEQARVSFGIEPEEWQTPEN